MKPDRAYFYALGKRKTARASVKLYPEGKGDIKVNGQNLFEWAPGEESRIKVLAPLETLGVKKDFDLEIRTSGGGKGAQSEAASLGIARALVKKESSFRAQLRTPGLLTRDGRIKERKKPGLKRARRAPQWSKR